MSRVPFLVFFDLVQHEYSLPLEILFLKVGPVWIPFRWFTPRHDWRAGVIYRPPGLVNINSLTAPILKLSGKQSWGNSITSCTTLVLRQWVLGKTLLLDRQLRRMCQKKYPRLGSPFSSPLPFIPRTSQFLEHHSAEGAIICQWGSPKDRGWSWEIQPRGHMVPRGPCKVFPAQRLHHFGGEIGVVSLQVGPPGSGDWVLMQIATGPPGPS